MEVVTVFSAIIAAGSILLTIYYQRKSRALYKERFRYSWADIEHGLLSLLRQLQTQSFGTQVIVTISGAGSIVGNLAMVMMDRQLPLYTVMLEDPHHPWGVRPQDHEMYSSARWVLHIPKSILGEDNDKNILIIDDTCVTGTTTGIICDYLRNAGFRSIKCISLLRVQPVVDLARNPDLFYFQTPNTEFYYPWGKGK
jgi:hypoxanthine phosphoribosyltransferase